MALMHNPWHVPSKGEIDPMALMYNQKMKWCNRAFPAGEGGWFCNRPINHDGHHVGSDSLQGTVYYIEFAFGPEMQLPEGF
jgi:hypothetical protein